jgi:hypothetical protein
LILALAAPLSAGAHEDRGGFDAERVEPAQGSPFPVPGPLYDAAGRIVAKPPANTPRSRRDVLLRREQVPK